MGEMSKKLSEIWKATSNEEKAKYEVCVPLLIVGVAMQPNALQGETFRMILHMPLEDA